jgi:hypothetical protein
MLTDKDLALIATVLKLLGKIPNLREIERTFVSMEEWVRQNREQPDTPGEFVPGPKDSNLL